MIRFILLSLALVALGGSAFLYFWDIPIEKEMVEIELEPSLLRE